LQKGRVEVLGACPGLEVIGRVVEVVGLGRKPLVHWEDGPLPCFGVC